MADGLPVQIKDLIRHGHYLIRESKYSLIESPNITGIIIKARQESSIKVLSIAIIIMQLAAMVRIQRMKPMRYAIDFMLIVF